MIVCFSLDHKSFGFEQTDLQSMQNNLPCEGTKMSSSAQRQIYFPAAALALRLAKAHKGLFGSESISILEYLYTQNVFGNLGISKGISKSQGI